MGRRNSLLTGRELEAIHSNVVLLAGIWLGSKHSTGLTRQTEPWIATKQSFVQQASGVDTSSGCSVWFVVGSDSRVYGWVWIGPFLFAMVMGEVRQKSLWTITFTDDNVYKLSVLMLPTVTTDSGKHEEEKKKYIYIYRNWEIICSVICNMQNYAIKNGFLESSNWNLHSLQ